MYALDFVGRRFDVGDKLGFLQATVELPALGRSDSGGPFREYLTGLIEARDVTYELRGGKQRAHRNCTGFIQRQPFSVRSG